MKLKFTSLTLDEQLTFVAERQRTRTALYRPARSRGKRATLGQLAQIWGVDKAALKDLLLTLPEFADILKS